MLEYENQVLLDLIHEDGLLLMARGLGIDRILIGLLASYSDKGNLVLVIGLSTKEVQYVQNQMQDKGFSLPKNITSECAVSERTEIYMSGGCMFITSRIFVVDLLMERVPISMITGIIVWKAHRVIETGQEAFILRLYKQKNKTGFVKALSMSPLSFTFGFCQLERIMKNLFVKKLYLYPRFHIDVARCLNECKPDVIELHLKMTHCMNEIQMALLDLITVTLQELKLSNSILNIDEFSTENAISAAFENMLKIQLDPIWHQLSIRTRQLVADVKILRLILLQLTNYDCVTFYNLVNSLRSTEKAMQSAGWMLLPAAETLYVNSKIRVFGSGKGIPSVISPEINPKWLALSEILSEISKDCIEKRKMEKCLVVTKDDRTEIILREYLENGGETTLKRIFYSTIGPKLGLYQSEDESSAKIENCELSNKPENKIIQWIKNKSKTNSENEEIKITESRKFEQLLILIHPLKSYDERFMMNRVLREIQPKYIIMYDLDLNFVREVEVWQAITSELSCCVYFMLYKGTTEEQAYLTDIKREKNSFEYLIKEKASMVLPEFVEGRTDAHPDLHRNDENEDDIIDNKSTRKVGETSSNKSRQKIIVDMREFRSDLPAIIHKLGIDIEPATIEVGDYILTPEICVERKSISDLIGSLNSGRLYNQAQKMTRHYKKPIILIEFDHNKPFYLQGRLILSSDNRSSSKDIMAKLQLLTLHFPNVRILWCPSPYATAELFHMLKSGKAEPTTTEAQLASSEFVDDDQFNRYIQDFVVKLPGVTSKNLLPLLRNGSDLMHLLSLGVDELTEILGHSKNAKQLHSALHSQLKEPNPESRDAKGFKRKFGKTTIKKFSS